MVSSCYSAHKQIKRATLCALLSIGFLSGCVSVEAMKSPNESFGVAATDRTLAQRILDQSIENTAVVNISRIEPNLSQQSRISVDSFYSNVLLTGEVPDEESKKKVETVVASMPDIDQLYNRLVVANVKGTSYTVHDAYITSKLNAKILANNAIKTSQVKVVTEDGVVYVMGKLTPSQREHLINIVNSTVGIKELVLLTQLVDNNGAVISEDDIIQETNLEPPAPEYTEEPVQIVADANVDQVEQSSFQQPQQQSQPQRQVPVIQGNTASAPEISPESNRSNGSTHSDSNALPEVVPAQGSDTSYNSPYIEMYKQEVNGW